MYTAAAFNQTTPSVLIMHLYSSSILGQMFMDMESTIGRIIIAYNSKKNDKRQVNKKFRKFEV